MLKKEKTQSALHCSETRCIWHLYRRGLEILFLHTLWQVSLPLRHTVSEESLRKHVSKSKKTRKGNKGQEKKMLDMDEQQRRSVFRRWEKVRKQGQTRYPAGFTRPQGTETYPLCIVLFYHTYSHTDAHKLTGALNIVSPSKLQ